MKKFLFALVAALVALAAASAGCADTVEGRILREWKAEHDYRDEPGGYPLSVDMRGRYGETYVFYINGTAAGAAITVDIVDNVYFSYPSLRQLEVYNGGRFYTLSSAFEAGLLSHEDLLDIQKNYNDGWNWSAGGIMLRDYLSERGDVSLTEADILTEIYWAGYEQFVLFINAEGDSFDCKVVTETVGGVEFVYPTTQTLLFYGVYNEENGSLFNTLGWAFEKGYLTHDDLLGISGNYVSGTTVSVA